MIQSDHNFARAMTAELSWHVQSCDLIGSLYLTCKQGTFCGKIWIISPWTICETTPFREYIFPGQNSCSFVDSIFYTLQWRHNGRHGISNHQPHHCLLNSPHKWPVTWKMVPFVDVIMYVLEGYILILISLSVYFKVSKTQFSIGWHWTRNRPLSVPVMTIITNTCSCQLASMG